MPFAPSFSQEDIDHVLRLGSNLSGSHRMAIAILFMKEKTESEIVDELKAIYYGGNGFQTETGRFSVWYDADDGIHMAKGNRARYSHEAYVFPWPAAVRRIGQLLDEGKFLTGEELLEIPRYERHVIAESIQAMRHYMSEEAVRQHFFHSISLTDDVSVIQRCLNDPAALSTLKAEMQRFSEAYQKDNRLLNIRIYAPSDVLRRMNELSLPRREYSSTLVKIPSVYQFITEDEIEQALRNPLSVRCEKGEIHDFFKAAHTMQEKAEFLRDNYSFCTNYCVLSCSMDSHEYRDANGIRFDKDYSPEVAFSWLEIAQKIDEMIQQDRYMSPDELRLYEMFSKQSEPEQAVTPSLDSSENEQQMDIPPVDEEQQAASEQEHEENPVVQQEITGPAATVPEPQPATPQIEQISFDLFPTEEQQISFIDAAESKVPFASSISQEDIDLVLQLGGNTNEHRMMIAVEFMKQKPLAEIADMLKTVYLRGDGFSAESGSISAWYAQDGIHIARGNAAQYAVGAKTVPWSEAAQRIGQLLEEGHFATNLELIEAPAQERLAVARDLAYLLLDMSSEAREQGFLPTLSQFARTGFPDTVSGIERLLADPQQRAVLQSELAIFAQAHSENRAFLRYQTYQPARLNQRIGELSIPRREYESELTAMPDVPRFITEDEISESLSHGSNVAGSKGRIYAFFSEPHTSKEKADFLKHEYGIGGSHSPTRNDESHDAKGIRYRKPGSPEVTLNWNNVAKRIDELIRAGRYLSVDELAELQARREENALAEQDDLSLETQPEEAEPVSAAQEETPDPEHAQPEAPEAPMLQTEQPPQEPDQPDESASSPVAAERPLSIDDAIRAWNGDMDSKRAVVRYMRDHARDREAARWLAHEYGGNPDEPLRISLAGSDEDAVLPWSRVQHRITRMIQEDSFFTDAEQDRFEHIDPIAIREALAERGIVNGQIVDNMLEVSSLAQQILEVAEGVAQEAPDLSDSPIARDGDTLIIGEGTGANEVAVTVTDEELEQIHSAIPEAGASAEQTDIETATETEQEKEPEPVEPDITSLPYAVGDTVYLDGKPFEITQIGTFDIRLRDPSLIYPVLRSESRESLDRLLRLDERNARFYDAQPVEEARPKKQTETVAVYPAIQNSLPYDIVIQTIHVEEPERDPPAPPPPENYRIVDDHLGEGGPKTKYRYNADAIRTLKRIEQEGRTATPEEQEILSRYVGWGGIPQAFDEHNGAWADEYIELKTLLTPDEYKKARASTLNAHYTSPTVIRAIYDAVGRMGFTSGNVLEPSCGVGNFFGLLPEAMQDSRLYGVELDSITGRIAQQLYPKADITVAGFETTNRRDFFDLAVGNVPFGSYKLPDKQFDKHNFLIHDYFVAKMLDQVRPGGMLAFVTSKGTMDKQSPDVRRYIAQRAELLGAVRLPNNAFKGNAGTEVTTDILFLQKRDRPIDIEPDWVHLGETENGVPINSYFVEHPEMVLGRMAWDKNMYGNEKDTACLPIEGAMLADQLAEAVQHIEGQYKEAELPDLAEGEDARETIPADPDVKNYSYAVVDGHVYYRENSVMVRPSLGKTAEERVKGLVELRDCVQRLISAQLDEYGDEAIREIQTQLNDLYDRFTAKNGLINSRANNSAFSADSSYYLLCSLEILNEKGELDRKADMFSKRTVRQENVVDHVDTPAEALAVSISERAGVDVPFMAQLTGRPEEEIVQELSGIIFRVPAPEGEPVRYVTADEYLAGNVREKLRDAQIAAAFNEAFNPNVQALEAAQPKDLDASEIDVRLGATWIKPEYVEEFMHELLNTPFYIQNITHVQYMPYTAEWNITNKTHAATGNVAARMTYGTDRANAFKILEDTLNLRDVRIFDTVTDIDGRERRVLNQKETTLAQQKQQAIKTAFQEWIWKDANRRRDLVMTYNEMFNSLRPREYDGKHIHFAGMNPEIELREHQRNAIAHVLYGGNTLLAHEVGAGKTFEMVAAAMESKRLGLCSKAMFVVPNHLTEQWASEFLRLYPSANILVTTKKDFETRNRKKFCARIATGDYDAIIIGHSQFERIPISQERQERLLQEEIDEITESIEHLKAKDGDRFTVKQLEKTRNSLQTRLKKLTDSPKDDVVTFEQLGVDRLYVDEAHSYKNLFLVTKMRNVAGLSASEAQKSTDMFLKCRYIDELTGGRGVVFATGTPVSNSMTELYTMQRYLQYQTLKQKNLIHFDCWASTFGETVTAIELAPEGTGYRARTRFAKFFNLPELMAMFKEVADIKTADQLHLPTPQARYETVVVKPSEYQKKMVQDLSERAAEVHSGKVDPSVDNMLKIVRC